MESPSNTCTKAITFKYNGHSVTLLKGLEFEHNGVRQRQPKTPSILANGQIIIEEFFGRNLVLSVPSLSLKIMYDELTRGFAISVPVVAYHEKLEGLCGDCNLDPQNDCLSPVFGFYIFSLRIFHEIYLFLIL